MMLFEFSIRSASLIVLAAGDALAVCSRSMALRATRLPAHISQHLHQHNHLEPEHPLDLIQRNQGILNHIMQQRGNNHRRSVRHAAHQISHSYGMADIRLASIFALLPCVSRIRELFCPELHDTAPVELR